MMQDKEIKREVENDYQEVLFLPRPLQARELNVLQAFLNTKISRLGKSLFRDGTLVHGSIKKHKDKFIIEDSSVFFQGLAYKINKQEIARKDGEEYLLAKTVSTMVSADIDVDLKEKIKGTNFNNPGANRTKTTVHLKASKTKDEGYTPLEICEPNVVQDSLFDLVIHTDSLTEGFKKIKDGMRIFVKGGIFRVYEPLKINASNVHLEFHPKVRIFGTKNTPKKHFFIIRGKNISMTNLYFGWDTKPNIAIDNSFKSIKCDETIQLTRSVKYGDFDINYTDIPPKSKQIGEE